jgi:DNA-binding PadR family transcriptional regulator
MGVLKNGPNHGYGIGKSIREISNDQLKLSEGQLYPILHELEEKGWISGDWEIGEGDPPRRIYALTEEGNKELQARTKKWAEFTGAVGLILNSNRLEASHD